MRIRQIWRYAALVAAGLLPIIWPAAADEATHPTLRASSLPEMVPLRDFFTSPNRNWFYQVSPDGRKLAWYQSARRGARLKIKSIDDGTVTTIRLRRAGRWLSWARDSRHTIFFRDRGGDENTALFVIDTAAPDDPPRLLTPAWGVRALLNRMTDGDPAHIFILMNERDVSEFDLHRVNILTGERTMVAQNPGTVMGWLVAGNGAIAGRYRRATDRSLVIEAPDGAVPGGWRGLLKGAPDDWHRIVAVSHDGRYGWGFSGISRDKSAIVRLDLRSGTEQVLHQEAAVDMETLYFDEAGEKPMMALSWPGYPKPRFFDAVLESDLSVFRTNRPAEILLTSYSRDLSRMVVRVRTDTANRAFYLFDRRTRQKTLLGVDNIAQYRNVLSEMKPISFKARDGLQLHGYLTIPNGTDGRNLPMVLKVHGGPHSRDVWGYDQMTQFLASRGYAVLYVDYRGSFGYGRAFRRAIRREFARKAHDDLIDGVNWAIARGIADPKKIAIYGRSYGGYATLVGMTFTPDVFAAGVDIVGMSDLVAEGMKSPPYWKLYTPGRDNVGDRRKPKDRADMAARSPINFVDRIRNPILIVHGANDVRVDRAHSDRMVAAMRAAGKEVDYLLFDDDGHKIGKPKNRIRMARRIETFLARHLGGRSETPLPVAIPADTEDYFVIRNDADFADHHVQRVRQQLHLGLKTIRATGLPIRTGKFPVTVHLKSGRGISRTNRGEGPMILFQVARTGSPIIHELTHVLLGYTWEHGHWTQEGIASYFQDKHGEDRAYPTRKIPHAVMKVILEEQAMLSMESVMKDRDRHGAFGRGSRWNQWLAYSQSSSFAKFLIETHGLGKFMAIYDKPYEEQDFADVFGKPVTVLIDDWLAAVRKVDRNLDRARRIYRRVSEFAR